MSSTKIGAIVLVALSAIAWMAGPAKPQTTASSTTVEVSALVGTWDGWWIGGQSYPVEVTVNADGTYVSRVGTDSGSGTFRVVNDVIHTEGHLTGGNAPLSDRTATATLVQKNGAMVLTGNGRTSAGPYSFTLTKR